MTHSSLVKDELSKILAIRKVDPEMIGEVFRVIVPEIVEKTLELSPKCNCCKGLLSSESQIYELRILDKISTPVFTGQKIKGEGASVRVALYDLSGAVVKSGREANANIKVVVLKEDSEGDGGDNLTVEDFERKIVKAVKGEPLLKGTTMLRLKEGCCDIGEISFVHNSGWVKNCKLSLAARVVDNFPGITIRPARTESFMLKDRRNSLYLKKYPPSLSDEIWRIKWIGKKGAFRDRLKEANIESVKDFLKVLVMEPDRLEEILGAGPKTWKEITEHASTCLIDESLQFFYYSPEHNYGVVFNVVGKLKGLLRDSQIFPVDGLSDVEKANAQKLVMSAFQDGKKPTPYNDKSYFMETCPPFSGSPGLKNPNECICEPLVTLNTSEDARPGISPQAYVPSISCVGESSRPDQLWSDPGLSSDYPIGPIYSPDSAHHQIDDAMLLQFLNGISNSTLQGNQSSPAIVLDTQVVSNINVSKRWRKLVNILNAIVTVKAIGATGRYHAQKKRKISSPVHTQPILI